VLRQVELLLRPLPPDYPCTTNSYHCLPVHRNRIKDLVVQQPNEVWVADLTYVRTEEGFLYLSLLTDKYLRKIAGYACGENLAMAGRVAALAMAVRELPAGAHPISHFDQGVQYCSHEYAESLAAGGLTASMTEKDHCAKNALAERMNGILKSEYGLGQRIQTKAQPRSGSIHPQLPIQY
jgi:putative transposase